MKVRTKKQIEKKVKEIWTDEGSVDTEISVKKDRVDITLSSMYSPPGLSFANLKALSEFFETDNINDADGFASPGCDTCDYGSSYGFTLVITP